jgi:hypothetical protein
METTFTKKRKVNMNTVELTLTVAETADLAKANEEEMTRADNPTLFHNLLSNDKPSDGDVA